ncbi:MAG: hypothetical protein P8X81_13385 [Woeseiaceae bacterium]|jgi:hypothetical protein
MGKVNKNLNFRILAVFAAVTGLSASAFAADDESMVFGKFRLLKNGYETRLGEGFFGNTAFLRLYRADDQEEFSVKVKEDGEFSVRLAPGDYYLMSIAFKHKGETVEPETNFMFNVSDDYAANYVGTITLEAKFKTGYQGTKGSFDRFIVSNDCESVCETRLAKLGLEGIDTTTSLPEWQQQVAFTR